jgi:hypothetical protein
MHAPHGIFFFEGIGGLENPAHFGDREVAGGDGGAGMDRLMEK